MKSTFLESDVTILLKDISGAITTTGTVERERFIQSGGHYSEMLPVEYEPSVEYLCLYQTALERFAAKTARTVAVVAAKIYALHGRGAVVVSLARAGTPIGILLKRYAATKYGVDWPHYTISIIKGRGIDRNAMRYILKRHAATDIQFVDGWTGKGTIARELTIRQYNGLCPALAVLSDPPRIAGIRGTVEDFLIPSSCLNAVVSGLISRTVLNSKFIGEDDFHGAVFYRELAPFDRTYEFINRIIENFPLDIDIEVEQDESPTDGAIDEVQKIKDDFSIPDINLIKPGIGEATRVLLRRLPWKLLVYRPDDYTNLGHLYRLAEERSVETMVYPLKNYRACGLIQASPVPPPLNPIEQYLSGSR
jgi:hypothetical protein